MYINELQAWTLPGILHQESIQFASSQGALKYVYSLKGGELNVCNIRYGKGLSEFLQSSELEMFITGLCESSQAYKYMYMFEHGALQKVLTFDLGIFVTSRIYLFQQQIRKALPFEVASCLRH